MKPIDGPVRWGIIGVGNVTESKSGPAPRQGRGIGTGRGDAPRRRCCRRLRATTRRAAALCDADALIHDDEVDAVYVATPPDSHADYAIRVAAAGKPVYVEKPMARTAAECDVMISACAEAGCPAVRRVLPPRDAAVRTRPSAAGRGRHRHRAHGERAYSWASTPLTAITFHGG